MDVIQGNSCVVVCDSHRQAKEAVRTLQGHGFDIKRLSIVGRGSQGGEHPVGFYNSGGCAQFWGAQGAFWDGLWGLLSGAAFFWVPGLGAVVIAGSLVSVFVAALEERAEVDELTVLGVSLYRLGIPKESGIHYETAIKADHYLLIVHGDQSEVARAHDLLADGDIRDIAIHLG